MDDPTAPRPSPVSPSRLAAALLAAALLLPPVQAPLAAAGLRWAHLLLLAAATAFAATPWVIALGHRLGVLDIPSGRKAHAAPTPLLGGLAVYAAFALPVLRNFRFSDELKGVAVGGTIVLLMGVIDDVRNLPARLKLVGQLAAVVVLIRYGVVLTFLPDTTWGYAGEYLLTALWVVGITNAVNFLDGMDGLATGTCCINALFLGLVAVQNGQYYMLYLAMPLAGACLGFIVYNLRPGGRAAVFLGDGGSTFLGFTVAALAVMGDWAGDAVARLIVPVLILGVPIFDMTFTTVARVWTGQVRSLRQWLEYTGRDHLHHRLEALRIGRLGSVLVIYAITAWLGLSALALKNATGVNALLQIAQSVIVFLLLSFFMLFVRRQYSEIEAATYIAGLDPDGAPRPGASGADPR